MGKYASSRSFGWGNQIDYAAHQALYDYYGRGHYGTVAAHTRRWGQFCVWLQAEFGVRDATEITRAMIEGYSKALGERVQEDLVAVSYAQNLLSTINVVLEAMRGNRDIRIESPSDWVGQRTTVRTEPPTGLDWDVVDGVTLRLHRVGLRRAKVVVKLARSFGLRLREATLWHIATWGRQKREQGAIDIREGTKGGRGKEVERWIPVSPRGKQALSEASNVRDTIGCGGNLLMFGESFDDFVNNGEVHRARRHLHEFGIKGYHDLRSAWACERYQQLTGSLAPVFHPSNPTDLETDRQVREILSRELGHDRIDVVAAYIGGRPE
jgi:hypothetical protein